MINMIENYFKVIIMQLYASNDKIYIDSSDYVTVGYDRVYYKDFTYVEDLIRKIESILNGDDYE